MNRYIAVTIIVILAALAACDRYVDSRDPIRSLPEAVPAPVDVRVQLSDGSVALTWEMPDSLDVSLFRVYLADSTNDDYELYDSTETYEISLKNLRINQKYFFQVVAVTVGGIEGLRSEAVSGRVSHLSIAIENGDEITDHRDVQIRIISPTGATHVILSEDEGLADAVWQAISSQKGFTLSDGDGIKTVYARLQFADGSESGDLLSDDITLDTRYRLNAEPLSTHKIALMWTGPARQSFWAYRIYRCEDSAVSFDSKLLASLTNVSVSAYTDTNLEDSRTHYYRVFVYDDTGLCCSSNVAGATTLANTAPDSVELIAVLNIGEDTTASLRWTECHEEDFESYRIYKGTGVAVPDDVTSGTPIGVDLVQMVENRTTTSHDVRLSGAGTFYFRVFVRDRHGLWTPSNEEAVTVMAD